MIAIAARPGTAAAAKRPRCQTRAPAANSMSTRMMPDSATVPKSGSRRHRPARTATIRQCGTMPYQNSGTRAPAAGDERAGQVEHEGELGQLAGLEGERAKGQPAPRTAADAADPGDQD